VNGGFSQSVQNFGSARGIIMSGNSTSFILDSTSSGTTYARIGAGSGSINKLITLNLLGTTDSFSFFYQLECLTFNKKRHLLPDF
jgi:hypothetical protein